MFSPTTPPDKKPILSSPSSSADNKINVLVRAQAGGPHPHPPSPFYEIVLTTETGELIFKVKLSTQFSKIASAFCKARGVDVKTVRFLSDRGQRLMGQTTIEEVCKTSQGGRGGHLACSVEGG
jgi:hypothetical protein